MALKDDSRPYDRFVTRGGGRIRGGAEGCAVIGCAAEAPPPAAPRSARQSCARRWGWRMRRGWSLWPKIVDTLAEKSL